MSVKRQFTVAQALALINQSEGNIVRDNRMRPADHDEPGAHSLGRHLVSAGTIGGVPSGPQAGIQFVKERFMSSPNLISSAWYKKGDMAIRLNEALNSPIGKQALDTMDELGLSRVVVHYRNQDIMQHSSGIFQPRHMSVGYQVTPDRTKTVSKDIYNTKTNPPTFIKTIQKTSTIKGHTTAHVTEEKVVGIHLVLDQYSSGRLHLQTLFPSFELEDDQFEYRVGSVSWTVTYSGGRFTKKFAAS